ncbi:hypothetical protein GCM10010172_46510 [Paractinoplanes ferrugineus]|uniref:Uncharacterized protein n=1 Tax=Paractinoplanes ferrugineus TaxID=113564 RepID=A0A919MKJ4_9ACTN|nr:hypothetical protein [Actinoplanes ferrugineus]GIE15825.1 hypothetical protein Afe05nite_76650 [Actinoplanes ferrugineus]
MQPDETPHPPAPGAPGPAPGPEPMPVAPPPRRRALIGVLSGLGVVALLAVGGAIAYFSGAFDEKGRFAAVPPPCATLEPGLPGLGAGYTTRAGNGNTCEVLLPGTSTPMMTVGYYRGATPGKVGSRLRERTEGQFRELSGLGDEGYTNGALTVFRVSNLMVGISIYPNTGTTDAQIRVFETDLASRLAG